MSKAATTLFILSLLLLCYALSDAARPQPLPLQDTLVKTQHLGGETQQVEMVDESCEGVGEDECLMRRTLAAHVDYIYTQKRNKP